VISAAVITPQNGDAITYGSQAYKVTPPTDRAACWRQHDAEGTLITVYAKRVA